MRWTRPRPQQSPMVGLAVSLFVLAVGLFFFQRELRIHRHGHRVLARIESVSHGRRSSSTTLRYTTLAGTAADCRVSGSLGQVGTPRWILYLPESPSICTTDDHHGYQYPFFMLLIATVGLIGSWTLYQRARRGDSVLQEPR